MGVFGMLLEIDDETAIILSDLAKQQHMNPAQLIKQALAEYREDLLDVQRGEEAYQRYLDSGCIAHDLHSVVKELGLDG